jgi:asparagine synthase (glutamine-hydrolysing)
VPYLDLELLALAESIPAELKIRGRRQKVVLKKAMEKWLPSTHIHRRKIGFGTPIDEWLRRDLRGHLEERLLDRDSGCRSHFEISVVERMIKDHARGREDHKRTLFALLTFEIWHELFMKPRAWNRAERSARVPVA